MEYLLSDFTSFIFETAHDKVMHLSIFIDSYDDELKKIYKEVNSELKLRRIKPFKNLGEFEAFMFGEYEKEYHSSNPRKLISDFIVK